MGDKGLCFLAMPFGRNEAEQLPYAGWRAQALEPAIIACGYRVELAASNPEPVPIAEQVLRHLVEAPMAVFDIGGFTEDDVPNPNVMYELGIRHAFGRPAIIYSPGARLPFDVQPGRAVIAARRLELANKVREELAVQIVSAAEGKYWRPMEAVGRFAQLQQLAATDQHLAPLVNAIEGLATKFDALQSDVLRIRPTTPPVGDVWRGSIAASPYSTPVDSSGRLRSLANARSLSPDTWAAINKLTSLPPETLAALQKLRITPEMQATIDEFARRSADGATLDAIRKATTSDES
jgi:hypothetical protein